MPMAGRRDDHLISNLFQMTSSLILLLVGLSAAVASSEKVHLTLYYESLCPDSIAFIVDQLYPTWKKMSDSFDIDLVPYGNAKDHYNETQQKWVTECQHGVMECKGNKMAACAIDQQVQQDKLINFINCMESTRQFDSIIKQCATKWSLDFDTLEKCYNGQKGAELLLYYGKITRSVQPKIQWVPTIAINNVVDLKEQDLLVTHLPKALCQHITGVKPRICQD